MKFLDDWLNAVWGKKFGLHVNFCRMIQKGLFVIFLKSHNMQERILKKGFWNVGHSLFRAYAWSPNGNFDKVIERSSPNWVEIKNLQAEFWPFISHIFKPLGDVLQIEESRFTLPHMIARVLVALSPDVVFPDIISLELEGEKFSWEVSLLCNLHACFHCKLNGHLKKKCLAIKL
jgi:hypothetical protein